MSYALSGRTANYSMSSESSGSRLLVSPSDALQSTSVVKLQHDTLSRLIWPDSTSHASRQELAARVEYLERELAKAEHAELVRRASVASVDAWQAFFDDEDG